jgi:GT2 family glycosyltransferase
MSRRALFIFGMHRSGTSLAAGIARLAGLDLGRNLLVGEAAENPRGFWEHRDVMAIDEELLAAISLAWSVPSPLPEGWLDHPRVAPLLERAAAVLEREFAAAPAWAIKDPRLCRLWPFWERAAAGVSEEITGLLVYRHPLEVAASLAARDSMPLEQALLAWLFHCVEAVGFGERHSLEVVSLAAMLADPVGLAERLRVRAGLTDPLPEVRRRKIEQFVDAALVHHRDPGPLPDTPTGRLAGEALACLEQLGHGTGDDASFPETLAAIRQLGRQLGDTVAARRRPAGVTRQMVDVVVPVYGGGEATLACLDAVLAGGGEFELVVIDDASPEPELSAMLRARAGGGEFTLLEHSTNLGFVASANRGLALHPDRDVVLLNSDTLVPPGWLDRLRRAAEGDFVGTVTPFSNNATLASYPIPFQANRLPAGWSAAELDQVFREANAGWSIDIPTAVGFCMYLRRDCLAETGPFDERHFGRGYGEETDYCMRARAAGWRHVLAADLFVFHRGEVSFGGDAETRRQQAGAVMRVIHPGYEQLVHRFRQDDPLAAARDAADVARAARRGEAELRRILVEHREATASRVAGLEAEAAAIRREASQLDQALGEAASLADTRLADLGRLDAALGQAERLVAAGKAEIATLTDALATAETIVAAQTAETRRLDSALANAQQLATERLADLGQRDAALAEATGLAEARLEEITRVDAALADAERLLAAGRTEIVTLTDALAKAENIVAERTAEAERLATALASAQQLATERLESLGQRDAALAEATALAETRLEEIARLDAAFGEASGLAESRLEEITRLDAGLKEAATLADTRLVEIGRLDAALAAAERFVEAGNAEIAGLTEALAAAEAVVTERTANVGRLSAAIPAIEQLAHDRLASCEALDRQLRETAAALAATEDLARRRLTEIEKLTRQVEVFTAGLEQAGEASA